MKMKAEIRVLHLQAKECQRFLANYHNLVDREQILPHSLEKEPSLLTL